MKAILSVLGVCGAASLKSNDNKSPSDIIKHVYADIFNCSAIIITGYVRPRKHFSGHMGELLPAAKQSTTWLAS